VKFGVPTRSLAETEILLYLDTDDRGNHQTAKQTVKAIVESQSARLWSLADTDIPSLPSRKRLSTSPR
jgi:hypothetical protein